MSEEHEEEEDPVVWAFVDVMSNYAFMLLIVMLVFMLESVSVGRQAAKEAIQEVSQEDKNQIQELKQQLAKMAATTAFINTQTMSSGEYNGVGSAAQTAVGDDNKDSHIVIEDKEADKTKTGTVQISNESGKVIIKFPLTSTELDDHSATELGHVAEAKIKSIGKHKLILRTYIGRESYTVARRMAYYRAMTARNALIAKAGETPSNIILQMVAPDKPEDGRVEIIIQKE